MTTDGTQTIFHIYLLKTSHYDDDGYPIIWRKALVPSNSLAALNALCLDCKERQVFGANVEMRITIIDETNTRISPRKIAAQLKKEKAIGFVAMVGVQTNQFPRTLDLSHQFIAHNIPVCIGGFHVAGYLSTMKTLPPDVIDAQKKGISFFTGEGEAGRVEQVLQDAFRNELKPLYNFLGDLPKIAGSPTPVLPQDEIERTEGRYAPFDLGRGCPFNCSFCTIINVHGQKSRFRTVDDLEKIIRSNYENGVRQFFLADDNIARNKNWETFFDRLFALRKEGLRFRIFAQVDTACHRIPNFVYKALQAGIDQLLIGLESMNPKNLESIQKKQNKISQYQEAMRLWKRHHVVITGSYIVGLPYDTVETIRKDVELIKKELPVDAIYFTNLTPLPGSMVHKKLHDDGVWMSDDYNQYDTNHCVTEHPLMSNDEWQEAYRVAWKTFYTPEHMETVLRRMVAVKSDKKRTTIYRLAMNGIFGIHTTIHPLDGGVFRKKYRKDRRPGLPLESPILFYPKHFFGSLGLSLRVLFLVNKLWRMYKKMLKDPKMKSYTDEALADQ